MAFAPGDQHAQDRKKIVAARRGELVVYLRLLGVPVPIVYGRSADESPF